jgi:hypothetical protein
MKSIVIKVINLIIQINFLFSLHALFDLINLFAYYSNGLQKWRQLADMRFP